ncbi:MAG TPA: hypothetical protein PKW66_18640, partial [Polyangiaceae bacterium]|nr:hypothetical protein [Polyangiaceae bacterium]
GGRFENIPFVFAGGSSHKVAATATDEVREGRETARNDYVPRDAGGTERALPVRQVTDRLWPLESDSR